MGSVEFMRLVRQRSVPVGKADQTKEPAEERAAAESEEDEQDMEVEPEDTLGNRNRSLEDMLNFIKAEHQQCINRNEYWDDNTLAESDYATVGANPKQCTQSFNAWTVQSWQKGPPNKGHLQCLWRVTNQFLRR